MRSTRTLLSRGLRKPIRHTAILAVLCWVGTFGIQAAESQTISLSEEICLSCAYESGLDRPGPAVFSSVEIDTLDVDAVNGTPDLGTPDRAGDSGTSSSFASAGDSAGSERAWIVLPAGAKDRSERLRFSKGEKALLWSFVSLSAVDAYQTMNAPGSFREANPLLASWAGDHPGTFETLAFKGATTYAIVKLAGRVKKRSTRRLALVLMNAVQLSVAAHNEEVTGGILF